MSIFLSDLNWKKRAFQRIYFLRLMPLLAILRIHPSRKVICEDLARWRSIRNLRATEEQALVYLLTFSPEFRSQVYWRMGAIGHVLKYLAPGLPTLHILMPPSDVGPGLYIQHGESTFVHCHKIGKNAWINQGVTIGYTSDDDCPTIGNDVRISTGAKVLGSVTIGDNVTVGPNAVVLRSVPAGATVSPPASRVLQAAADVRPVKRSVPEESASPLLENSQPAVSN